MSVAHTVLRLTLEYLTEERRGRFLRNLIRGGTSNKHEGWSKREGWKRA